MELAWANTSKSFVQSKKLGKKCENVLRRPLEKKKNLWNQFAEKRQIVNLFKSLSIACKPSMFAIGKKTCKQSTV